MKTYYILTTTNGHINGWSIIGKSGSKKMAIELADKLENEYLEPNEYGNVDIESQTFAKNIRIMSKTKAIKNGFLQKCEVE